MQRYIPKKAKARKKATRLGEQRDLPALNKAKPMAAPLEAGELVLALDPSSTRTGWAIGKVIAGDAMVVACGAISRPSKMDWRDGVMAMAVLLESTIRECAEALDEEIGPLSRAICEVPGTAQSGRQQKRRASLAVLGPAAGIQIGTMARMLPVGECHLVPSDGWCKMKKAGRIKAYTADLPVSVYDPSKDTGDQDTGDAIALLRWWTRMQLLHQKTRK